MRRFITKSKELIAIQSEGKFTKEKITNEKLVKFLYSLIEASSLEDYDKNDLFKYEETKSHIIFIVNYLMSETYVEKEEEAKISLLEILMDLNRVDKINISELFKNIKDYVSQEEISIKKNIISIIKNKPNIKIGNIIFNADNQDDDYLNEEYFYKIVFNGKELIKDFIEKYKVKKVLEFNSNIFDEIIVNHQSFNFQCLQSLNEYLEYFDKIYRLYNSFNSPFKQIEKINDILIIDDDFKNYFKNIYNGFEKGIIDINLSFDKKIAKLEIEQKNANLKIKELTEKIYELNGQQKQSEETIKVLNKKVEKLDNKVSIMEKGFKDLKESLKCPITDEIMKEPVITPSGNSYEKKALQDWIKIKQTDPKSVQPLTENQVYPNLFLGNIIEKFNKIMEKLEKP